MNGKTNMQQTEDTSSSIIDNMNRTTLIDNIDEPPIPIVSALHTSAYEPAIRGHVATLKKLKEKERELQLQQEQIKELQFALQQ